ncbi:MAG: hypothetical protein LBU60_01235 [Clostridiales bacterium]|jgi:hypothetical protein|nr:hypothetical protein [Clostridiales bacterium]
MNDEKSTTKKMKRKESTEALDKRCNQRVQFAFDANLVQSDLNGDFVELVQRKNVKDKNLTKI